MKIKKEQAGHPRSRRYLANGTYSIAVTMLAFAALILVNLIAGALPSAWTTFDVTGQKLFSVSETTKGVLDALTDEVTLHLITEAGQEDEAVSKLVEAYAAASPKIKVNRVDAVRNPTFASQYSEETVPLNSVIAVCGDRSHIASYDRLYVYDEYGYYNGTTPSYWDAEGQITSAIARVSVAEEAKVYYTTGHDEMTMGNEMTDSLEKAGISSEPVNLLSSSLPADCDALIIFSPAQDFTDEEVGKVTAYLEEGGRLLLMTMSDSVTGSATPHLDSIMAGYGVTRRGGLVMEQDASAYVQAPYLVLPSLGTSEVTDGLSNQNIVCALPEALEVGDTDEAVYTVTNILLSSEDAYLKEDAMASVEKTPDDESGRFVFAVAVEQTLSADSTGEPDLPTDLAFDEDGTETERESESKTEEAESGSGQEDVTEDVTEDGTKGITRILYYSTPCLFSASALSTLIQQSTALPEGNTALFAKSIAYLTDQEQAVSVNPKSLGVPQTVIDMGAQSVIGNLLMFALPALTLAAGFIVFRRRRRR